MKQFQYTDGYRTYGPYTLDDIEAQFPRSLATVQTAQVGDSVPDQGVTRVTWTRLPDLEEPQTEPCLASDVSDERLERIATAVITGLCANSYDGHQNQPLSTATYADMAKIAVEHARALIAELDKPA